MLGHAWFFDQQIKDGRNNENDGQRNDELYGQIRKISLTCRDFHSQLSEKVQKCVMK
jgi:hypothetical protein